MKDFDLFKGIKLFEKLPDTYAQKLFGFCKRVTYEVGDIIMEEGEDKHSMFFFLEGEVVVSSTMTMKASHKGGGFSEVEKSLVKLTSGQIGILGEMSVIEQLPRSATVKAYTPCVLYEIQKKEFHKFLSEYPKIGITILLRISKILCHRVRRGNKDIIKLSTVLSIALSK